MANKFYLLVIGFSVSAGLIGPGNVVNAQAPIPSATPAPPAPEPSAAPQAPVGSAAPNPEPTPIPGSIPVITPSPTPSPSPSSSPARGVAPGGVAPSSAATAHPGAIVHRISGRLLEKGTKTPLADVNVYLLPAKLKATTDASGQFVFEQVPEGEVTWVVNAPGYIRLEQKDRIGATGGEAIGERGELADVSERRLLLEKVTYNQFETVIVGKQKKRDDTTHTLRAEQFLAAPGAQGDPVKAVQNLPGVARAQGGSAQVIIQGSAPQDTQYLIDQHPVPLVFHFGGLTSVITPEAVSEVDYLSAGYGPEYGRAMGGLVGLRSRDPAKDRRKGFAFMDITKAGGLIEGQLDEKRSYLLTGRYSYLGFVLQQALKNNDQFNLTVAPSFGDLTGIYNHKVSDTDDFRLLAIGSRDELSFVLKEPVRSNPSIRGTFRNETNFYRFIPQWTHRHNAENTSRWSLGLGQDRVSVDAGENFFNLKVCTISQRAEWESKVDENWTSFLGMDNNVSYARGGLRLPNFSNNGGVNNPISGGESEDLEVKQTAWQLGPYWRNMIHPAGSAWTFTPSLRADYFTQTKEILPAPRLAVRYDFDESLFFRSAGGLYFQPPEPQETAQTIGNPDLKSPRAWHMATGFEKDFRAGTSRGWSVTSGLFFRKFEKLVVRSSKQVERDGAIVFERFNNEGQGKAYGIESTIRWDAKPWSIWLVYTLSRSVRQEPGQDEHLFQYDQTHNINLMGSLELNNNWALSSRIRYVTGNPYTPIQAGIFDADNDVYVPVRGPFYSERLTPFFQADLRIDKKWVYSTWILSGYLDIQNITNRANPEGIRYAYDYSESRVVSGLPLLPIFGVRGDF